MVTCPMKIFTLAQPLARGQNFMQDADFLNALKTADHRLIRQMYDRFLPVIVRLVENNSGSRDDALDIFQETIMVLHRKSRESDFTLTSSLSTYLYAIARNLWMKRLNKKSFSEVSIKDTAVYKSEENIMQAIEDQEKYRLFKTKMDVLKGNCRKILEMFFEGISMEEIAEKLGLASVGYAKKRKFICKEQLLGLIRDDVRYQELKG